MADHARNWPALFGYLEGALLPSERRNIVRALRTKARKGNLGPVGAEVLALLTEGETEPEVEA